MKQIFYLITLTLKTNPITAFFDANVASGNFLFSRSNPPPDTILNIKQTNIF